MNAIFDSHAHYDDQAFDSDRDSLLTAMPSLGVGHIINAGASLESSQKSLELSARYPYIYAACGVHPELAGSVPENYLQQVEAMCLSSRKVKAVGEIGLDYHYDLSPRECQKKWFAEQLELAKQLGYPVVLHIREAFGDCMDILHAHRDGLRGVMHCYSGSVETAFECLDLGLKFSFGGAVTFKNAKKPVEVVQKLPLDSIMLETDCPYMTPVPHRGERNHPGFMHLTAEKIAEVRGISAEEVCSAAYKTANSFFGIE